MFKMIRAGAALILGLAVVFGPVLAPHSHADAAAVPSAVASREAFHDAMRKLWEDHIVWTRQFIISAATLSTDLPDRGPTTDRLLANQSGIGNAIKPFYGDSAGEALTGLLREHILTAAQLVAAAKAGDAIGLEAASGAWYANADEIATFLSSANPDHWPLDEMKAMMRSHLDLTLAEAVARLQGRYADDIAAYEEVHAEILQMADMLSSGLIRQFPAKFAR